VKEEQKKILDYLQEHEAEIFADLKELVLCDSPSADRETAQGCARAIQQLFRRRLGLEPAQVFPQESCGDHLSYRLGEGEKKLLLIGHYDTVWAPGQLPLRQEGNKLYGPGVFDMKSGLVLGVWALKTLKELNIPLEKQVEIFLNSDEETMSKTSAPIIMEHAKGCEAALVLEPAEAVTGRVKTRRKGSLNYRIRAYGKASHAGNDHRGGVNAIEEIARQTVYLHSLTDYDKGTTVNVGFVKGGVTKTIVPDYAEIDLEVRCCTVAESQRMRQIIDNLKPVVPGARLEIEGGIVKQPLERSDALYAKLREAAAGLELEIDDCLAGGGSDGNFTYAVGVPTIDGLGACGESLHAPEEHIYMDQYLPRIALLASYLTLL